ncbi:MAG: hypothetical protein GY782_08480 [Gammaproteobacteria bacterium]|nr:hypothetical protein [Gammaproteobacteria bacterium]
MAVQNSSHTGVNGLTFVQNNGITIALHTTIPGDLGTALSTGDGMLARSTRSTGNYSISTMSSGVRLSVSSATAWTIDATGVANYICICASATVDSTMSATGLFYVIPVSSQTISSTANSIVTSTFSIDINDATT